MIVVVLTIAAWLGGALCAISPLVIPPSLFWDGDDGRWSTFFVGVGTPAQYVKLLPGTSVEASTAFWVVHPIACDVVNAGLANCADRRGGIFDSKNSTTWSTQKLQTGPDGAIYTLTTVEEAKLGITGNGSYGFDTVSLGLNNGLPTLQTLVAGIWTGNFFLGSLPLSPYPTNFTFSDPIPSLMGQLRNSSQIPSLSYGYTAGAYYQDSTKSKFGSLTLGGYDTSRFQAGISFPFGSDYTRDLLLKLDSITYDTIGSTPLMSSSINVFIDSLVSELWLPVSVCERFRTTFNLTYNSPYYLVDKIVHAALLKQNPRFSFRLSSDAGSMEITMPYAAFDLNLTAPIVGNETGYFPIRQAQNESQYVLGRTFLQEAYIVVDYEKRNFSVNQAVFPSTSVQSNIVAIEVGSAGAAKGLSGGAIAGIVVGAVAVVAVLVLGIVFWRKRKARRQRYAAPPYEMPMDYKVGHAEAPAELDGRRRGPWELAANKVVFWKSESKPSELAAKDPAHEMASDREAVEMPGHEPVELPVTRE